MKNAEIADMFDQIADMLEILGENQFRIVSYRRAAHVIETLTDDVADLAAKGTLTDMAGIGESTAAKIQEYLKSGKITRLEELKAQCPPGLPTLMRVQGLGPKTALKLWKQAGIDSLEALKKAIESPEAILKIPGMGKKKLQLIAKSLEAAAVSQGRLRLAEADALAARLVEHVKGIKGVGRVIAAGSLRRGRDSVGDIDLLCEAPAKAGASVVEAFTRHGSVVRVLAAGETKGSVLLGHAAQADLRVVERASFGAALAYFTGSKDHNVHLREMALKRKWKLNEYGLFKGRQRIAGGDEEGVYKALGLQWIEPELRENRGEIEAAAEGNLPELLRLQDVRGDFHMHTVASDGLNSIDEMIDAARRHGYRCIAITDHSKGQPQAGGMNERDLLKHVKAIHDAGEKHRDITVLAGCEVDIKKDGSLDFEDDVLAELDLVVAAPHAALAQEGQAATERLLRAIANPHVHIIAHPTGRIVNGRKGMDVDIERVARAAAEHDVALEVNADPSRLDLRDVHVRTAIEAGAKLALCTDSHSIANLDVMRFGVTTARRGWARASDVINTWAIKDILAFFGKKR